LVIDYNDRFNLTHSNTVVTSLSSSLARSPHFDDWALGVVPCGAPETDAIFNELAEFILPKSFTHVRAIYVCTSYTTADLIVAKIPSKLRLRGEGKFYGSLKEWGSLNAALVETNPKRDVFGLGAKPQALFVAYWAILEEVQKGSCELAQRRGVDTLIQLAFAIRLGATHEVWCVCVFLHCSLTQEM
jgi:hypothetical protein